MALKLWAPHRMASSRVFRRGAKLTDGMNEWEIVKIDPRWIWVNQPGTVTVPFSYSVCERLSEVQES